MAVVRHKLAEGELSMCEKVHESIRVACGISRDKFYGMCGCEYEVSHAFLNGLSIGLGERQIREALGSTLCCS